MSIAEWTILGLSSGTEEIVSLRTSSLRLALIIPTGADIGRFALSGEHQVHGILEHWSRSQIWFHVTARPPLLLSLRLEIYIPDKSAVLDVLEPSLLLLYRLVGQECVRPSKLDDIAGVVRAAGLLHILHLLIVDESEPNFIYLIVLLLSLCQCIAWILDHSAKLLLISPGQTIKILRNQWHHIIIPVAQISREYIRVVHLDLILHLRRYRHSLEACWFIDWRQIFTSFTSLVEAHAKDVLIFIRRGEIYRTIFWRHNMWSCICSGAIIQSSSILWVWGHDARLALRLEDRVGELAHSKLLDVPRVLA